MCVLWGAGGGGRLTVVGPASQTGEGVRHGPSAEARIVHPSVFRGQVPATDALVPLRRLPKQVSCFGDFT